MNSVQHPKKIKIKNIGLRTAASDVKKLDKIVIWILLFFINNKLIAKKPIEVGSKSEVVLKPQIHIIGLRNSNNNINLKDFLKKLEKFITPKYKKK